ncbi:Uncharacterized protein OBRU01_15303 [Operophtera brumata]|uniref:Uncharacterized protein n=1 Tax=Operophtera brumata TaxID=104452 RepID=A0A0L7L533_OPEBR|nr:Uncharacterized protein OBRU01_15303 [Operophtera brumata]
MRQAHITTQHSLHSRLHHEELDGVYVQHGRGLAAVHARRASGGSPPHHRKGEPSPEEKVTVSSLQGSTMKSWMESTCSMDEGSLPCMLGEPREAVLPITGRENPAPRKR